MLDFYYRNPNGTLPLNVDGNPTLINIDQRSARCCCRHPCYTSFACCEVLESYSATMLVPATFGGNRQYRFTSPITITAGEIPHYGTGGAEEYLSRTEEWRTPSDDFGVFVSLETPTKRPTGCFWEMVVGFGNAPRYDSAILNFYLPVSDLTNKPPDGLYQQEFGNGVIQVS